MSNKCVLLESGDNNVKLATGRLTYPNLAKPKKKSNKYEATIIFEDDADLSVLTETMTRVSKEKFGDDLPPKIKIRIKTLKGKLKKLVFDNESKNYNLVQQGPDKGKRCIQCSDPDMPVFVDEEGTQLVKLGDDNGDAARVIKGKFYAGCYVSVAINLYAGEFKDEDGVTNKYLSAYMKGVKFEKDGEPLGATRMAPEDMFGKATSTSDDGYNEEDDDDDMDD